MLDKSTFYRMVAMLRKYFVWSPQYREVRKRCQYKPKVSRCEGCEELVSEDETLLNDLHPSMDRHLDRFYVDHREPVGSLDHRSLDRAAASIFCDTSNLWGLCGCCHYLKSQVDNEETRNKKKSLLESIILGEKE